MLVLAGAGAGAVDSAGMILTTKFFGAGGGGVCGGEGRK